jgi:uncharacterized protein
VALEASVTGTALNDHDVLTQVVDQVELMAEETVAPWAASSRSTPRPVLIIDGAAKADEPTAARWFQAASPATVRVWVVPYAGHTQGLAIAPWAWETHVISFLNAALHPATTTTAQSAASNG